MRCVVLVILLLTLKHLLVAIVAQPPTPHRQLLVLAVHEQLAHVGCVRWDLVRRHKPQRLSFILCQDIHGYLEQQPACAHLSDIAVVWIMTA